MTHARRLASLRGLWWRSGLLVGSFLLGLGGMLLGAGVSDRAGIPQAGLLTQVYYALGLFVFGGLDLGVPQGGPAIARAMLWLAYFTSPAITAAAVIEGALRVIQPQSLALRRLEDHVVIAGGGELTRIYLEELAEREPGRQAVVIELDPDAPTLDEVRHVHRALVLIGDVTSVSLLEQARVGHAARVLLLTGDDVANAETAHLIHQRWRTKPPPVVTHVGNVSLMRDLRETQEPWTRGLFNSHEIAARHVVENELVPHFDQTAEVDEIVLVGFGRFGQSLLAELQARAGEKLQRVLILDLDAAKNLRIFQEQVPMGATPTLRTIDGDERDPAVWDEIAADLPPHPVFVLGADDESSNLHVALRLRREHPQALILMRTVRRSSFLSRMAARHGFRLVVVSARIRESMCVETPFGLCEIAPAALSQPETAGSPAS